MEGRYTDYLLKDTIDGSYLIDNIKNKIYQYLMRFVSDWERRETDNYDLGWVIYFRIV